MNLLQLVLKQMRQRALGSALTLLSVLLGVALAVTVLLMRRESGRLFGQTDFGYEVLIGPPKGSPLQLTLNTVYHMDRSAGNVPYDVVEDLSRRQRVPGKPFYAPFVRLAVPFMVGDSYRGRRIVGTSPLMFGFADTDEAAPLAGYDARGRRLPEYEDPNVPEERRAKGKPVAAAVLEYRRGKKYVLAEGRVFRPRRFEAVIGSGVASREGLKVGSTFKATHGMPGPNEKPDVHDLEWTVVGVLEPTHTANDGVLFVPVVSLFAIEEHSSGLIMQAMIKAGINPDTVPPEMVPQVLEKLGFDPNDLPKSVLRKFRLVAPTTGPATGPATTPTAPAPAGEGELLQPAGGAPAGGAPAGGDELLKPSGDAPATGQEPPPPPPPPASPAPEQPEKPADEKHDGDGHAHDHEHDAPAAGDAHADEHAAEGEHAHDEDQAAGDKKGAPKDAPHAHEADHAAPEKHAGDAAHAHPEAHAGEEKHPPGEAAHSTDDEHAAEPDHAEKHAPGDAHAGEEKHADHEKHPPGETHAEGEHHEGEKHEHEGEKHEGAKPEAGHHDGDHHEGEGAHQTEEGHAEEGHDHGHNHAHEHTEAFHFDEDGNIIPDLPKDEWEVSAVLVETRGGYQTERLIYDFQVGRPDATAVNPASVMREFFNTFLRGSTMLLVVLAALVSVVAAISILVSIYNSVSARQKEIAVMRALGATRARILTLICAEAALIGLVGGVLGLIVGHLVAGVGSAFFERTVGEGIDWLTPGPEEVIYLGVVVLIALLAGLAPALKAYRTPVATNLVAG